MCSAKQCKATKHSDEEPRLDESRKKRASSPEDVIYDEERK